jgi:hypothetical protein
MGINRLVLRLLVALGISVCILTGWLAAEDARTVLGAPDAPLATTVAGAPENRWVMLQDAVFDCSTRRARLRSTLLLANDRTGTHPFLARLAGTRACDTLGSRPVDGVFLGAATRPAQRERQLFELPSGSHARLFSQLRAPRFVRRALPWEFTWFGLSLLLTVLAVWSLWTSEPPRPAAFAVTKSGRAPGRD